MDVATVLVLLEIHDLKLKRVCRCCQAAAGGRGKDTGSPSRDSPHQVLHRRRIGPRATIRRAIERASVVRLHERRVLHAESVMWTSRSGIWYWPRFRTPPP